ncbi:MAG TPA: hypothetical protein VJ577_19685 [Burkholderiaceae bacterium]|nr:hypothetical protein [Burkholderiaceae bacterium]
MKITVARRMTKYCMKHAQECACRQAAVMQSLIPGSHAGNAVRTHDWPLATLLPSCFACLVRVFYCIGAGALSPAFFLRHLRANGDDEGASSVQASSFRMKILYAFHHACMSDKSIIINFIHHGNYLHCCISLMMFSLCFSALSRMETQKVFLSARMVFPIRQQNIAYEN